MASFRVADVAPLRRDVGALVRDLRRRADVPPVRLSVRPVSVGSKGQAFASPSAARMRERYRGEVLQAHMPSPDEVRKIDRLRCNQRPKDNAPRGGGGGSGPRRFVPWCS